MDFEPCFKVYNLVSIRPKSMKLGQMINLNVIFHMVGSVLFETRPSSPLNFGIRMAYCCQYSLLFFCHGVTPCTIQHNIVDRSVDRSQF